MMEKFLIKDSSGKKSVTMTAFVLGFVVVNAKLLLSGLSVGALTFGLFSGTEYGIAVSALGAIYILRRNTGKETEENND